jgi:hypothetical protein
MNNLIPLQQSIPLVLAGGFNWLHTGTGKQAFAIPITSIAPYCRIIEKKQIRALVVTPTESRTGADWTKF